MERFAVGADDAFVLLRKLSEERNVPLRRIAGHVVDAGGEVSMPVRAGSLPWPPGSSGSG
ncbi:MULTISPECIES: ANTAR domain-containing protein [Rhodococcus]|uniref:ANTAR domain-containing protein n=1 Tax=Rhodococcus TaxID=1827 RepID=UPI001E352D23|nr:MULTISPECIES: ANTAR domain-containing protein [Rhodococcus]MCW3469148.1 ANTAR domain-containing protein [Rhodococcus pyridinivorans]